MQDLSFNRRREARAHIQSIVQSYVGDERELAQLRYMLEKTGRYEKYLKQYKRAGDVDTWAAVGMIALLVFGMTAMVFVVPSYDRLPLALMMVAVVVCTISLVVNDIISAWYENKLAKLCAFETKNFSPQDRLPSEFSPKPIINLDHVITDAEVRSLVSQKLMLLEEQAKDLSKTIPEAEILQTQQLLNRASNYELLDYAERQELLKSLGGPSLLQATI